MNGTLLNTVLIVGAIGTVLGGCSSQYDKEISQRKHDIDRQRDQQMGMIEERAIALKRCTDRRAQQAEQTLNTMKRQRGADQSLIAERQKFVIRRADLNKRNIDQQVSNDKTQVNWNADSAKEQIDEYALEHKPR